MWSTALPAIIAAVAALLGVTLGTLAEPVKLNAARRARVRQERLDRCAQLVEAANEARGLAIAVNRLYRGERPGGAGANDNWEELYERHHAARAKVRTIAGVLRILGPDDLAQKAEGVRAADGELAHVRFTQWQAPAGRPVSIPPKVEAALGALDHALNEFVDVARRQAG